MDTNIMIVTGEASGDLHGSNLIKALRETIEGNLHVCGMGGPELSALGIEILFDAAKVSVVGVIEVVKHLKDIHLAQSILRKRLKHSPPDLLILVDFPDFNFLLAKKAHKLGIPIFYYISPQVWAWRSSRVKVLKKRVDTLGVILPFEEDYFASKGLAVRYVGHPLLDSVKPTLNRSRFKKFLNINDTTRCVGLLPGSRKREIATLLPTFLAAAEILHNRSNQKLTFLIPKASTIARADLEEAGLAQYQERLDIRVVEDNRYNLMTACDCAVAASGTVTLELAILQIPMVVTYKLSPLTYRLGKFLVKLDHFSLVNLIAGHSAVPELLQDEVTPENISKELNLLLNVYARKKSMLKELALVKAKLGKPGASDNAAKLVVEVLLKHRRENSYDRQ